MVTEMTEDLPLVRTPRTGARRRRHTEISPERWGDFAGSLSPRTFPQIGVTVTDSVSVTPVRSRLRAGRSAVMTTPVATTITDLADDLDAALGDIRGRDREEALFVLARIQESAYTGHRVDREEAQGVASSSTRQRRLRPRTRLDRPHRPSGVEPVGSTPRKPRPHMPTHTGALGSGIDSLLRRERRRTRGRTHDPFSRKGDPNPLLQAASGMA